MLSNVFKVEKNNQNLWVKANLLWVCKLSLYFQLLIVFLFVTSIFILDRPNSLKCDRSIKKCILNMSLIFDSIDVEIPLQSVESAKIKNYDTGNTIELITDLDYPVQLSYARFSKLDNPTETLATIKNFLTDESIPTLYIEQGNRKSNLLLLGVGSFIPISAVGIASILFKDKTFYFSKDTNELKITTKSLWQDNQETYPINQIEQVKLNSLDQSNSNLGMYKLNLIINSGEKKKIVIIDSPEINAIEVQKLAQEIIFGD